MTVGSLVLWVLRTLYLLVGVGTIVWTGYMGLTGNEELALLVIPGLFVLAAAVWVRSRHPVRRTIASIGIPVLIFPAFALGVFAQVADGWTGRTGGDMFAFVTFVLSIAIAAAMWTYRRPAGTSRTLGRR